jgi:uncharacterized OB-fold protein
MNSISSDEASTRGESALLPLPDLADDPEVSTDENGRPVLVGTECTECGVSMAGRRQICSSCGAVTVRPAGLTPDGHLYAFTTVHTGPNGPHVYGYVDLPGGARVFGTVRALGDELRCDQAVTMQLDGDDWFFRPM